jgi:outer membrane lipoprotein SlyB
MENANITTTSNRIHPLLATAAVAVILVSLTGVAAITGLLPTSHSSAAPQQVAALNDTNTNIPAAAPVAAPLAPRNEPAPARVRSKPQSNYSGYNSPAPAVVQSCSTCGEIQAVRAVQSTPKASGVGIAAGAVLGGVLGNQVGGGNGRTLATVAGALGGGFAGNEVEKRSRTTTSYVVDVRMENGSVRSFPQTSEGWRVGDQVRVVNGHLSARG